MRSSLRVLKEGRFQDYFYQKSLEERVPFKVCFELTYKCNLTCRHCFVAKDPCQKELNSAQIYSILEQLADTGCFYLIFTGGEIFIRPDVLQILAYAKKKGFHISVFTNGTLITPRVSRYLKKININQVDISIYGKSQVTHEAITGVPGSWQKALQGANLIRQADIPVCFKMIVMKSNLKEFKAMKEFARSLNLPLSYGYVIQPKIDGSKGPLALRISPQQAIELEENNAAFFCSEKKNLKRKKEAFFRQKSIFYCDAGKNSFAINPYGQMNLCLGHPLFGYDILKGSLAGGWNELTAFVESANPKKNYRCGHCKFLAFCQCCPAESWLEKGDRNACVAYFRELAKREFLSYAKHNKR